MDAENAAKHLNGARRVAWREVQHLMKLRDEPTFSQWGKTRLRMMTASEFTISKRDSN